MRLWHRNRREDELEREIQTHLDLEAEEQRAAGVAEDRARHAARRAFGNAALIREDVRAVWTWTWLERLRQDVRYGLRALRNRPAFSAAAILSLALGIGANTAIFSLIDALLLRSLPVRNPAELVQVLLVEQGRRGDSFGYPAIRGLAARTDVFEGLCGFSGASFNVTSREGIERVSGAWVTGGYYQTLGLTAVAGRLLTPDDDLPGAPPAAVLSYAYWESRFARNFGAVGQTIQIEGTPVRIAGVGPPGFSGANVGEVADLTLALAALPQLIPERAPQLESGSQWLRVLARPRPGVSIAQAKARLAVIWPQMASVATTPQMNPKRREVLLASSIDLIPGGTGYSYLRRQFQQPLLVLLGATGLVLLIACANFANLLLARGAARSREIALRFAIGARRGRIVRQLLTESVMLSSIGAALGIGLAGLASRSLVVLLSSGHAAVQLDLEPDARVLLFTSAVALATGILFGLVPALRATAAGPGPALKGGLAVAARTRSRLLPALVIFQVALSLVLLIGAGLFAGTLRNLERLDPGFRHEGVLLVNLNAQRAGYRGPRLATLYEDLLGRFRRLPGVADASLSSNIPLSGGYWSEPVSINGQPPTKESVQVNSVTSRFFETMGTPLVLGRDFTARDGEGAPAVAIVNETFVRRYFPDGHPLGQQIAIARQASRPMQIVGVVADTVAFSLREPAPPYLYLPYFQYPAAIGFATFEIRANGSLARPAALVRDEIRAQFPGIPAHVQVEPLTAQVERTLAQERLLAALGACFGGLALILAAVGLYGLLAYTVTRLTNEIGIRIALGAERGEVLWLVLKSALKLLTAGVVLGLPAAWAGSRLVASMLFGLTATDPLTIAGATVLLGATAVVAALLPARRASRVDPMVALRYE